jgi:hypothetical protein
MKTLREQLGVPVLFHRVGWHGKSQPNLAGYDSRDPKVITHQLEAMMDLGGDGTGVIHLHYGLNSPFINESALECCNQCNVMGMPFALCMDPWAVKDASGNILPSPAKEQAMIAALQSADVQFMLNSATYLSLTATAGKPVLDFTQVGIGADKATVLKTMPGIALLQNGPDFDWPRFPQTPNKTALPCKYLKFNDGTRVIPALGGKTFWDLNVDAGQYAQIVTLDDYGEGTNWEELTSVLWGRI